MKRLLKYSGSAIVLGAVAVGGLGGLNLYTYHRFTQEAPIGQLDFDRTGPKTYRVEWTPREGKVRTFELSGDEWQLDVRMIKWKDWLTFLGEDPLYRLDRISGRYVSIDDARTQPAVMQELASPGNFDVWGFARKAGDWLPGIDAAYGSSVYLPMDEGARYLVSISRTGLVARKQAGDS